MRTGAEYREALRDGRRVWILGEGRIDDVTSHPSTRPMVEEYVAWYDRHFDPDWQDVVLTPCDAAGVGVPVGYIVPRSADDLLADGPMLFGHHFPERREHHAHAGLWPPDRAWSAACGGTAQRIRAAA